MNLEITGRNVDVTPALREFALDKLGKLERLVGETLEAHVVLRIDKHRHSAEVQIKWRGLVLTGAEETGDLYASIGEVADKLERQLVRHKDKVRDHKPRRAPREAVPAGSAVGAVAVPEDGAARTDGAPPRIVLSRRYRIKPMSPEDALLELEASDEDLLVFRESGSYRINVLYRQKDGSFALVDPDF